MQMFSSVNNVWESINLVLCNLLNWIECAGFFNKCSQPCGNCRFNDQCNMSNGLCPGGCERGYTGDNCTTGNAWLIRNGYIKWFIQDLKIKYGNCLVVSAVVAVWKAIR